MDEMGSVRLAAFGLLFCYFKVISYFYGTNPTNYMQKRSIVLSDELIFRIEEYAIEERRKFSPTVAILIEKALKEIERNRNRKRGTGSRKFTPAEGFKEVELLKTGMSKDEFIRVRHFPETKCLINVHDDNDNISKEYCDHVEAVMKATVKKYKQDEQD